jgi:hypothetical protein
MMISLQVVLLFCLCNLWAISGVTTTTNRVEMGRGSAGEQHQRRHSTDAYFPFDIEISTPTLCIEFSCRDTLRVNSTSIAQNKLLQSRRPVVLAGGDSPVVKWKALQWNLWYWAAKSFPTLNSGLRFTKQTSRKSFGVGDNVFLVRDEELLPVDPHHELCSFPSYDVETEVLLWDFLNEVVSGTESVPHSEHVDSVDKYCRFYSTEYDQMEKAMKVIV